MMRSKLVRIGPGNVELRRGDDGAAVTLRGPSADQIATVYEHMQTHGADYAATYLGGVVDGMLHQATLRMRDVIEEAERHIAEGKRHIAAAKAREQ